MDRWMESCGKGHRLMRADGYNQWNRHHPTPGRGPARRWRAVIWRVGPQQEPSKRRTREARGQPQARQISKPGGGYSPPHTFLAWPSTTPTQPAAMVLIVGSVSELKAKNKPNPAVTSETPIPAPRIQVSFLLSCAPFFGISSALYSAANSAELTESADSGPLIKQLTGDPSGHSL